MFSINKTQADILFLYIAYSFRYIYLFILIPFYGRVLGVEGYGEILAALSLMQIIWLFTTWGFTISSLREFSIAKLDQYPSLFTENFSGKVLLCLVAILISIFAIHFSKILSQNHLTAFFAVILGVLLTFEPGWYFAATARPRNSVKLEVIGFILNLALILYFVRGPNDAWLAMLSLVVSAFIVLVIGFTWISNEIKGFSLNIKKGINLIKSTKVLFIYSSSSILLGGASTYILSTISDGVQVGYFGAAEKLVSAGLSLMVPIGTIFLPKINFLYNQNEESAYVYSKRLILFFFTIAIIGSFVSIFAATEIIRLIFGSEFDGSVVILNYFSVVYPLYGLSLGISAYLLIPLRHEKTVAQIMISGVITNILFAYLLSYQYGAIGMVFSRIIGELVILFGLIVYTCKLGLMKKMLNARINGKLL